MDSELDVIDGDLQVSRIIEEGHPVKCGEIIMEYGKKFSLICLLCTKQYDDLDSFGSHIIAWHLEAQSEDECKPFECLFLDEKSKAIPEVLHSQTQETIYLTETKPSLIIQVPNTDIVENNLTNPSQVVAVEDNVLDRRMQQSKLVLQGRNEPTKKTYSCNSCDIVFRHKASYIAHAKKHHGMITKIMKNKIIEETKAVINAINAIKRKRFENKRRHFSCPQCHKVCNSNSCLIAHVRRNHGIEVLTVLLRKYSCKYCYENLPNPKQLEAHILSRHPGDSKYLCPHCHRSFRTLGGRRSHIYLHTGERPFACPHCPKRFAVSTNLRSHIFSHLKIKKYACQYCDKEFVQSNDRNIHELRHTGHKPFQCENCGKRFFTATLLAYHRRRHQNNRNYKCDLCDKAYFTSTSLKEHRERHTGRRNYKCSQCHFAFITKKSLKSHENIHSKRNNVRN